MHLTDSLISFADLFECLWSDLLSNVNCLQFFIDFDQILYVAWKVTGATM